MPQYYEYELGKAAHKLVSEMFKLKPGETLVITADTESDPRVVDATAAAASHTEGICLNASVWLDEAQLTDKGSVMHQS